MAVGSQLTAHSSQLTAHSSQLTAHSSQLTALGPQPSPSPLLPLLLLSLSLPACSPAPPRPAPPPPVDVGYVEWLTQRPWMLDDLPAVAASYDELCKRAEAGEEEAQGILPVAATSFWLSAPASADLPESTGPSRSA